jgi:hypothetical protein
VKAITPDDLDNWFKYHPPVGDHAAVYEHLRAEAKEFAQTILDYTPAGPDQSTAIRKVREAVFTANAAIACGAVPPSAHADQYRIWLKDGDCDGIRSVGGIGDGVDVPVMLNFDRDRVVGTAHVTEDAEGLLATIEFGDQLPADLADLLTPAIGVRGMHCVKGGPTDAQWDRLSLGDSNKDARIKSLRIQRLEKAGS